MSETMFRNRHIASALGLAALSWLAGSSAALAADGVGPPQLAVGDHWQYRVTDQLARGAMSQVDVEVIEVSGRTARIRFQHSDSRGKREWIDEVDGQGGLRTGSLYGEPSRPFEKPVQMLTYPLAKGKSWKQVLDTQRDNGLKDQILINGKVDGSQVTTVPAGSFDTINVYRTVQFDDAEFWRSRTSRRDSIWYSMAVKAPVLEKREGQYTENGGDRFSRIRTESTLIELVSFKPGG